MKIKHSERKCPYCEDKFPDCDSYRVHHKRKHDKSRHHEKKCPICEYTLSSTFTYNRHVKTQHPAFPVAINLNEEEVQIGTGGNAIDERDVVNYVVNYVPAEPSELVMDDQSLQYVVIDETDENQIISLD